MVRGASAFKRLRPSSRIRCVVRIPCREQLRSEKFLDQAIRASHIRADFTRRLGAYGHAATVARAGPITIFGSDSP